MSIPQIATSDSMLETSECGRSNDVCFIESYETSAVDKSTEKTPLWLLTKR